MDKCHWFFKSLFIYALPKPLSSKEICIDLVRIFKNILKDLFCLLPSDHAITMPAGIIAPTM
jgi:hypothetical protein